MLSEEASQCTPPRMRSSPRYSISDSYWVCLIGPAERNDTITPSAAVQNSVRQI
jgi:hypothetical protein